MTRDHDERRYGRFGGRYVAEALWHPLEVLSQTFAEALDDPDFGDACESWLDRRLGRPTPLTSLDQLSDDIGGGRLLAKREDLLHGNSFASNMAVVYGLLARRMDRDWLVGETATGDFGVALASIGSAMGLRTRIFVGREDLEAEPLSMQQLHQLGAIVETVDSTSRGRKAACAEAMGHWATHADSELYCPSSLAMADPYPRIVEHALSTIGAELRVQLERRHLDPTYVVAPIGSGSFGVGLFEPFVGGETQLVGVQAGASGGDDRHAASLTYGRPGVFQGTYSFLLQDQNGQIRAPSSIAGGLCVPNVGPQHAAWAESGEVHYVTVTDADAMAAARQLLQSEGVLVSLEAAHAVAYALKLAPTLGADETIVVGISGSGMRDLDRLADTETDEEAT